MSRVTALNAARNNTSVKFLEFTRIRSKGKVAIFFEGEDEKYYGFRINTINPTLKWSAVICKGKENLLSIREHIRKHACYSDAPCAFFMDSDFDDNNSYGSCKDVYVTPCYSVENLYVSDDAFSKILSSELQINDECVPCYENAMSSFIHTKKSYLNAISSFNHIIFLIRSMEKDGIDNGKLNLSDIKIGTLVKIEIGVVTKKYCENNYKNIFPALNDGIVFDFEECNKFFSKLNCELSYRGKQHLDFMRIFLSKIFEDSSKKTDRAIFKNKKNVKMQLTDANCLSELSQYADTPECLRAFITQIDMGER